MKEKSMWQEIQKNAEWLEKNKAVVAEKLRSLREEMKRLDEKQQRLAAPASKHGVVEISLKDFEMALDELDPKEKHKVSIRFDRVEMQEPKYLGSPESLKHAKFLEGGNYVGTGTICLEINNWPRYHLKRCYLPENFPKKSTPTLQDMIMCFRTETVSNNKPLIDIFAQAEKLHMQTKSSKLPDGGKQ